MKRDSVIWLICLAAIVASGCVTKSTYDDAVAELEGTRAELQSAKAQHQLLTQEVATLDDLTKEKTRDAEAASARVQQVKGEAETERRMAEERIARLKRTVVQLTAAQSSMRDALEAINEDTLALTSTVDMYKMKLGDIDGLRTPSFPSGRDVPAEAALAPPPQAPAAADPLAKPTVTPPASPPDTAAPVAKPQPTNKRTSERTDESWFSAIKGWVISLWRSVFS